MGLCSLPVTRLSAEPAGLSFSPELHKVPASPWNPKQLPCEDIKAPGEDVNDVLESGFEDLKQGESQLGTELAERRSLICKCDNGGMNAARPGHR